MSSVKLVQTNDRNTNQLQKNILESLNPIINNLIINGHIIQKVNLITGTNIIPTGLNRNLIGWDIIRQRASASIYDNQDNNLTPSQNLILISSAPVVVDIYVF